MSANNNTVTTEAVVISQTDTPAPIAVLPAPEEVNEQQVDAGAKTLGLSTLNAERIKAVSTFGKFSKKLKEVNVALGVLTFSLDDAMATLELIQNKLKNEELDGKTLSQLLKLRIECQRVINNNAEQLLRCEAINRSTAADTKRPRNKSFAPDQVVVPVQVNVNQPPKS
jgi:hypothetical protein